MSKYTRYPLELMAVGEDRGSIPVPSRQAMLESCQGGRAHGAGYNSEFFYSRHPMAPFFKTLGQHLGTRLHLNEEVLQVDWQNRRVRTTKGTYPYQHLLSTLPLPELLQRMQPSWPGADTLHLPHTATLIVNGVLARRRRRFHWAYLPNPQTPFYRAGYYPNRPYTAFYLEQTLGPGDSTPDPETIRKSTLACLQELGMIHREEELLHHHAVTLPVSYVLIDHENQASVPPLLESLAREDIHSIGRYGRWHYSSMSADIMDALRTVQTFFPQAP